MSIIKQIELIKRIDQLVRMQATGTPMEFSSKLGVSKTTLYRVIDLMKTLDAPIAYCHTVQSFVYKKTVGFKFGFYPSVHKRYHAKEKQQQH